MGDGMIGRSPDHVVRASELHTQQAVAEADLLVIAATVVDGTLPTALLDLVRAPGGLDGIPTFVATIGAWPAEGGTAERLLLPRLTVAGARCVAPVLNVADRRSPAIAVYCRYWAPVVTMFAHTSTRQQVAA